MKRGKKIWKVLSWASFIVSAVPINLGFYKMFVYYNSEYFPENNVNAYVGGDAYNYIINGNYATAYFVLAAVLVIMGIGFAILYYLSKMDDMLFSATLKTPSDVPLPSDELPDL